MPIKPENKLRYPKNWKEISLRIRARDENKCKFCGIENGKVGWRVPDGTFYTAREFSEDYINPVHEKQLLKIVERNQREIKIVLTVAHLDHVPENVDDGNLAALCQRCHLRYDKDQHRANSRKTREKKKGLISLFD